MSAVVCPTPGKFSFKSRAEAVAMYKRTQQVPGLRRTSMRAYRCPCGRWHLTHMTKRAAKAVGARVA